MKTTKKSLIEGLKDKYSDIDELSFETVVELAFKEFVDQELPELQKELSRFEAKRFSTIGKVELLESIDDEFRGNIGQ